MRRYGEMNIACFYLGSYVVIALRSKAIVPGNKHRISEVFISGNVSLNNIIIFLSYKSFEACQIILWITKRVTRFS